MADEKNQSGGGGLLILLLVVFVTLKLSGAVDWSWWWVLSPLWIPIAYAAGLIALGVLVAGIACLVVGVVVWLER